MGLLEQPMQQGMPPGEDPGMQPQAPPEQAPEQGQGDPGEQSAALVEGALSYLYGAGLDDVTDALAQDGEIVERMATVIGSVLLTAHHAVAAEGGEIPAEVMVGAGIQLSKAVGEIAVEMGRLPPEGHAEQIETAFMAGLARFGQLVDETAMSDGQRQRYAELIRGLRDMKGGGQQTEPPAAAPEGAPQEQPQPRGLLAQGVR